MIGQRRQWWSKTTARLWDTNIREVYFYLTGFSLSPTFSPETGAIEAKVGYSVDPDPGFIDFSTHRGPNGSIIYLTPIHGQHVAVRCREL